LVLTVTLNPLLERRLFDNNNLENKKSGTRGEIYFAGGKGINVSRQLNKLGIKNHALTFMGGPSGKLMRQTLSNEGIEFSYVPTKSETRTALLTINKNKINTEFEPNSEITNSEAVEFENKFEKMIRNCSIVVFSGSSPSEETNHIFAAGIELAHKYDKIAILDTYGSHLEESINRSPLVLHNNKEEIEKSLGWKLEDEKSHIELFKYLKSKNVNLAFITDSHNPSYASKFGFNYKIISPKTNAVDATGSGDAFVAGIIYGLERSMIFDDFVCIASALGAANAERLDACNVDADEYEKYIEQVHLIPIGKKVKLIDDSPHY
jgi:tagatose 6-phosphate kinase